MKVTNRARLHNLCTLAKNAVGSNQWRSFFVEEEGGQLIDVLDDGDKSCAFFITNLLVTVGLLSKPRLTVTSAVSQLLADGWAEVSDSEMRDGDVLVWETNENGCSHIGFYVDGFAISNSSSKKSPQRHCVTYGGERSVSQVLRFTT